MLWRWLASDADRHSPSPLPSPGGSPGGRERSSSVTCTCIFFVGRTARWLRLARSHPLSVLRPCRACKREKAEKTTHGPVALTERSITPRRPRRHSRGAANEHFNQRRTYTDKSRRPIALSRRERYGPDT